MTFTHLVWHLGDHMLFLNFLRKVARAYPERQFTHYSNWEYLKELELMVQGITNVKVSELSRFTPTGSHDVWINYGNYFNNHAFRNDFVKFYLDWYGELAKRLDVENPIKTPEDMLFDYPAILQNDFQPFDVLLIAAKPGSGQFEAYNEARMIIMAERMGAKGLKVWITAELPPHITNPNIKTTKPRTGWLSCAEIGGLSLKCPHIVMVSTGPSWPTFNIWNRDTVQNRLILLDNQRVFLTPRTRHFRAIPDAEVYLHSVGLL